jgi:hypothetical protein
MPRHVETALLVPADPEWAEVLAGVRHDVYHLPGYVAVEAARMHGQPLAVLARRRDARLFLPLVLVSGGDGPLQHVTDALSPYGYPTLLCEGGGDDPPFLDDALAAILRLLASKDVASLFLRTHPLLRLDAAALQRHGAVVFHGETVWMDLRLDEEELWRQTRAQTRNAIRRLLKAGVTAEHDSRFEHYDAFIGLYYRTMDRNAAAGLYYFDRDYFLALRCALGERLALWVAKDRSGRMIAAALITAENGILQYHLACTDHEQPYPDAMKLLLHVVRSWGKNAGYECMHLGGGRGAGQDSLFLFKSGFSRLRAPFATWRAVCNEKRFREAVAEWERGTGQTSGGLTGYFPPYRR